MQPYFQDDSVTIYHGDCLDVLPQLAAVDHVITDPPYEAEAHTNGRRGNTARDGDGSYYATRPLDFAPIDDAVRLQVGSAIGTLSRGWVLVFCQVEAAMTWAAAVLPARYMRTQIWRKPNAPCQFTGDRPGMGYESIVTAWAGGGRSRWNGGGRHGVYTHMTSRHDSGHMTEKPLALMRELITLFTDPGDVILDPFAGSGTTLRAAKDLGRRAIGIEISEAYVKVAIQRMSQAVLL